MASTVARSMTPVGGMPARLELHRRHKRRIVFVGDTTAGKVAADLRAACARARLLALRPGPHGAGTVGQPPCATIRLIALDGGLGRLDILGRQRGQAKRRVGEPFPRGGIALIGRQLVAVESTGTWLRRAAWALTWALSRTAATPSRRAMIRKRVRLAAVLILIGVVLAVTAPEPREEAGLARARARGEENRRCD